MHQLVYLLGAPGSGKSTVMKELAGRDGWELRPLPFAHRVRGDVTQLGADRAPFGGTDTLSYIAGPEVELWTRTLPAPYLLGEGDRLAYRRFFERAAAGGYLLRVFYLHAPPAVARQRRAARAAEHELELQDPRWARGRARKAARLAGDLRAQRLDAGRPAADLAAEIRAAVPGLDKALAAVVTPPR